MGGKERGSEGSGRGGDILGEAAWTEELWPGHEGPLGLGSPAEAQRPGRASAGAGLQPA